MLLPMTGSTLEQADKETQLAVDLIFLLESNNIEPQVVLAALKIVESDFLRKLKQS